MFNSAALEQMDIKTDYSLEKKYEKDFLHVHVTGERVREVLIDIAKDIVAALKKRQYTKVLIDVTQLRGHLNTIDTYDLGTRDFPTLKQNKPMKIAICDNHISENLRFFETVSRNIGLNIRVFTIDDDAIQWLRSNEYL